MMQWMEPLMFMRGVFIFSTSNFDLSSLAQFQNVGGGDYPPIQPMTQLQVFSMHFL